MNCHDSGKARGDIDIRQYHDDQARLAGDASMLKMFAAALEKKEMPQPSNNSSQQPKKEQKW